MLLSHAELGSEAEDSTWLCDLSILCCTTGEECFILKKCGAFKLSLLHTFLNFEKINTFFLVQLAFADWVSFKNKNCFSVVDLYRFASLFSNRVYYSKPIELVVLCRSCKVASVFVENVILLLPCDLISVWKLCVLWLWPIPRFSWIVFIDS